MKSNCKINEEKRKNMGIISNEFKNNLENNYINPKTNKPIKKTCYSSENIVKKIIRIIIRQLYILLNNNIQDKERYSNLSKILTINNNTIKNKKIFEVFKQLEENNIQNSITNVTIKDYERICNMTINDILETLKTSRIYKNYFPFHNFILKNLIKKDEKEYKVHKLLNLTFSECLLLYQYLPLFFKQKNNYYYLFNENIKYYLDEIENNSVNIKEIDELKNKITDINFDGVKSLFDTIILLQNKKNNNKNLKYKKEYIKKYIDTTLGYHKFFLDRKRKRNKEIIEKKDEIKYEDKTTIIDGKNTEDIKDNNK